MRWDYKEQYKFMHMFKLIVAWPSKRKTMDGRDRQKDPYSPFTDRLVSAQIKNITADQTQVVHGLHLCTQVNREALLKLRLLNRCLISSWSITLNTQTALQQTHYLYSH